MFLLVFSGAVSLTKPPHLLDSITSGTLTKEQIQAMEEKEETEEAAAPVGSDPDEDVGVIDITKPLPKHIKQKWEAEKEEEDSGEDDDDDAEGEDDHEEGQEEGEADGGQSGMEDEDEDGVEGQEEPEAEEGSDEEPGEEDEDEDEDGPAAKKRRLDAPAESEPVKKKQRDLYCQGEDNVDSGASGV